MSKSMRVFRTMPDLVLADTMLPRRGNLLDSIQTLLFGLWFVVALGLPATLAEGQSSPAWNQSQVGGPDQASGSANWDGTTMTLSGQGAGLNIKGADHVPFIYQKRAAGDFEVIARLKDFDGEGTDTAGLMARTDDTATSGGAAVYFGIPNGKNSLNWLSEIPATADTPAPRVLSSGIEVARKPPIWIKMIREGTNIAFYKSADGKLWTMISNTSGGLVALKGPVEVGFFVSGGSPAKMVTAAFDSIQIGEAQMDYETSWVGNTFGSVPDGEHVSNNLDAMWVAPDGTCYTNSFWDEEGAAGASYREGKVWRTFPGEGWGGGQACEGSITGDANHLFVVNAGRIAMYDLVGPKFNPVPIDLTVNLANPKGGTYISGLASNGHELYVADSLNNIIRVVSLDPYPTYQTPGAANDRIETAPGPVVVPTDDPRFAPAEVYQTRRSGEGVTYKIPGLTPGATYTVRCHLAAYADKEQGMGIGKANEVITLSDLAGGKLKAVVKDFPGNTLDKDGTLHFSFGGYGGGVCGLEVLDSSGTRVFAINCGGPTVGDFKGESPELVDQEFHFDRPGPMTFDKRGNLWIIQRGNDFPIGSITSAKYPAAVKCYKPEGTLTRRQITDVINPRALAYDAAKDQLLVGENGPDLNVRFYSGLNGTPVLDHTFGEKGGVFAGPHPGLISDPAAGGDARFAAVSGIGVDAQGNLYVGGDANGTDLRQFTPDGRLGWILYSLMFCNTYDVDPASDGTEIYGTYNHLHLDLSQTVPGSEQKLVSYNWNPKYGPPVRVGGSQSIVRRLGQDKRRVMFTSAQGSVDTINIYRYDGEIAIPCGAIRGNEMWIDADGDGVEEPGEVTKVDGSASSYCVDSKGDIWLAKSGASICTMRHFFFKGINDKGVPLYSGVKGEGYEDIPCPEEGGKVNAWAESFKLEYDADRDIMVAFYPTTALINHQINGQDHVINIPDYAMARYDNWSKGNREPTWKIHVPTQEATPEYFMMEVGKPYNLYGFNGMQVAGDYVFLAHLWGEIMAFDLKSGKVAETFPMGPEVAGCSAWEDAALGLSAFKCKNGEYLIFDENSGYGGKNNFIRWKPAVQTAQAQ